MKWTIFTKVAIILSIVFMDLMLKSIKQSAEFRQFLHNLGNRIPSVEMGQG